MSANPPTKVTCYAGCAVDGTLVAPAFAGSPTGFKSVARHAAGDPAGDYDLVLEDNFQIAEGMVSFSFSTSSGAAATPFLTPIIQITDSRTLRVRTPQFGAPPADADCKFQLTIHQIEPANRTA